MDSHNIYIHVWSHWRPLTENHAFFFKIEITFFFIRSIRSSTVCTLCTCTLGYESYTCSYMYMYMYLHVHVYVYVYSECRMLDDMSAPPLPPPQYLEWTPLECCPVPTQCTALHTVTALWKTLPQRTGIWERKLNVHIHVHACAWYVYMCVESPIVR